MSRRITKGGSVFQKRPNGPWYLQWYYKGKRYRLSSGSHRKGDANALLDAKLKEIARDQFHPHAERVTLGDLRLLQSDDYRINGRKSWDRAERCWMHISRIVGADTPAIDCHSARWSRYVRHRMEEGASASSIRQELAQVKRSYRLAVRDGLLPSAPVFPTIVVSNARAGFFEPAEFAALREELPSPVQPVVTFMYWTGWRRNEVLNLTWSNVDLTRGTVRLERGTTKTGEPRVLPFNELPELRQLLRAQRGTVSRLEKQLGRVIPWVFVREDGGRIRDFRAAWQGACARAGLIGKIPHDFRRTAVRRMERAGVPRSVAMQLVGHRTQAIYERYAITNEADLMDGVRRVAALSEPHGQRPLPFTKAAQTAPV